MNGHLISQPTMKNFLSSIYPFLYAIFPILALRNVNIVYVDIGSITRSIILSLLITGLLWVLLRLVAKNWDQAGLITTLIVLLFFSYGHAYLQAQSAFVEGIRHRHLLWIC